MIGFASLLAFALGSTAPDGGATAPVWLTPEASKSLRLSDATKAPHRPVLPAELSAPGAASWGLFKVCVDASGAVTTVSTMRSTGQPEKLDARWMTAIQTWRYTPHQVNGQAVPFCHPVRLDVRVNPAPGAAGASPDGGAPSPGNELILAPHIGTGLRLTDVNRAPYKPRLPPELNKAGAVYWGMFKVCVAATGEVTGVGILRSTGEPALLDDPWIATMKRWRYRPYTVDGRPVPFCHPVRLQVQAR
jgi:TonB family protein